MFKALTLVAPFLALFDCAQAAPVRRAASATDILVFQFAGVLERLETEFYKEALAKFQSSDFTAAGFVDISIPVEIFSGIALDESTHSSVIETQLTALGAAPITTCKFNFGDALKDVATMAATARVVENVGVSAYLGGANLLEDKELLVAAATILTVEARHQSLLNVLNAATSIPAAFDMALTPSEVLAIAGGFISGCDLGIPALPSLTVTNTGPVAPGTSLTFSSSGIPSDTSGLTCQMMIGGALNAIALPFNACIVPEINGPVYIYVTNTSQPLLNDIVVQFTGSVVAGPTLAFIDSKPEDLGQVAKSGTVSGSSSSGSVANAVAATATTITPAEATALVQNSGAQVVSSAPGNSTNGTAPATSQDSGTNSTSPVVSASAPGNSTNTTAPATSQDSGTNSTSPVTVIGWSNNS